METKLGKWIPQVLGDPNGESWEITVVREGNKHGRQSWGWIGENKLLVSHNGGPCRWPMAPGLGDTMVLIAKGLADELNSKESCKHDPGFEGDLAVEILCKHCGQPIIASAWELA